MIIQLFSLNISIIININEVQVPKSSLLKYTNYLQELSFSNDRSNCRVL